MKTIVLTGMMGSGKSTAGRLLAQTLNVDFLDIDLIIETNLKTSISEIFARQGENEFRKIEKETIFSIFRPQNQVISLGGGAFENEQTRKFLLEKAAVIYLETSPDEILKRIQNNSSRPLLNEKMNIQTIEEIINKRKKNYQSSHYTISTDNKNPQDIINELKGVIQNDKSINAY